MHRFTLFLLAALAASTVHAASYLKNDGSIVNPIHYTGWSAYNDLAGNLYTGNVTNISGPGNDRPAGSLSPAGTLVNYFDNSSTGITWRFPVPPVREIINHWGRLSTRAGACGWAPDE